MDIALAALAALTFASANPTPAPLDLPSGPRLPVSRVSAAMPVPAPRDTMIEYSAFYYKRLTVHRWASYTMLPLFAAQYYVGSRLYSASAGADEDGNKDLHEMLAAGTAGLFAVNTVTGLWNLWDGRRDPNDRGRRVTHAVLLLIADAGFVATGILADEAEDGAAGGGASTHRAVAIGSMAVSTVGWLMMTDLFRKD